MSEKQTLFSRRNISVSDFVSESIKKWYITLSAMVVAFVISLVYTLMFVTPLYKSTAKIFILSRQTEEYFTTNDFNISTYLSNDFAEIIVDSPVLDITAKELGNKYSIGYLKRAVKINKPEDTRIIVISATSPDPEDSKKIVDSVCKNAKDKLVELMKLDSIEIIKEGDLPSAPSSPNLANNISLAVFAAFVISEICIFINFALNNKVSSVADVENCLGLNVLATIPYNQTKKAK